VAETRAGRKTLSLDVIMSEKLQQSIMIFVLSFLKAKCSHFPLLRGNGEPGV
jgi:hypothetical protein